MIKAKLFVLGTQRELLSTKLTYYKIVNPKTGRSGPTPMGGLVTLTFVSGDGDDRLLSWITHSPEGQLCTLTKAKIVFYEGNWDGIVLFAYKLHDAALVHWKEEFKTTGTTPMTVTITISAAIQVIKGVTWTKTWQESGVLSGKNSAREKEGQEVVLGDRGKGVKGEVGSGGVVLGTRGSTTVLEGSVKNNFARFVKKVPANSKSSATFKQLKDGNYLFEATSSGRVPGSKAVYQKWVNPQGETFKMLKTTFGPDGKIIHVKPK